MKVSVVIPVYNRMNELCMALLSLQKQTLSNSHFEVIIADDGSSEDIPSVLKSFTDLNLKYVYQPDEGFRVAAARNLGADLAEGKIIVFNDNGILLKSDTLENHCNLHDEYEDLVALANMMGTDWKADTDRIRDLLDKHDVDTAIRMMQEEGGMRDGRESYFERFGNEEVDTWSIPWLVLWGGHFSVRTSFVHRHNIRWNESFTKWGGEDNEYGIQLCNAGALIKFCRTLMVVHYPTSNRANQDITSKAFRENYRNTQQHILKLHPTQKVRDWVEMGSNTNSFYNS